LNQRVTKLTKEIARRKEAEAVQHEKSESLRVTLASIGDAVISTDAEGRVTFLNAVAESLTGWTQAEAAGRPLPDVFRIVDENTRQPAENPAARALLEGRVVGLANHTLLIARDGTERPIDDSAAPIRDGDGAVIGAVLVFRDVTERMRTEEVRARLAAIVESSDDAIVSKTLDGVIRSWNAGAERLFGYTPEEAVGRPITLIIPPERHDEERTILDRLTRGERIEHFETVRVAKDGRRIDISLTVSPVRDAQGRVIGASKVARDVTERKRAEAERERAEAERERAERYAAKLRELGIEPD
jgi:PAS domain S-box-containing protein